MKQTDLIRFPFRALACEHRGASSAHSSAASDRYIRRTSVAGWGAIPHVRCAQPGNIEHFLAERYCLYTAGEQGRICCDIHHRPWSLQMAEAAFQDNSMADAAIKINWVPTRYER